MTRAALLLAALAALAGCGSLTGALPGLGGGGAAVGLPAEAPRIAVHIPARKARVTFVQTGENAGVTTWTSAEGQSVALRDGLLVATRGMGFDLMATDPAPTRAALSGPLPRDYLRRFEVLDGESRRQTLVYGCRMEPAENGRREVCANAEGGSFANLYILDGRGGLLRSAQFVSPGFGALAFLPAE